MQIWHRARIALMLFVVVAAIGASSAQVRAAEATTGTIAGTVLDTNGLPVEGARVVATSPSGRYETRTDARGRFALLGVTPDFYALSVEHVQYQGAGAADNLVLPGQTTTVGFQLAKARCAAIGQRSRGHECLSRVGTPADTFTVSRRRRASPFTDDVVGRVGELHGGHGAGRDRERAGHRSRSVRQRDRARREAQRRCVRLRLDPDTARAHRRAGRQRRSARSSRPPGSRRRPSRWRAIKARATTRWPASSTRSPPSERIPDERRSSWAGASGRRSASRTSKYGRDARSALALRRGGTAGSETFSVRRRPPFYPSEAATYGLALAEPRAVLDREQRPLPRRRTRTIFRSSRWSDRRRTTSTARRIPARRSARSTGPTSTATSCRSRALPNQNAPVKFAAGDPRRVRHPQGGLAPYRRATSSRACSSTSRSTRRRPAVRSGTRTAFPTVRSRSRKRKAGGRPD